MNVTFLQWKDGQGIAGHDGVTCDLRTLPNFLPEGVKEVTYVSGEKSVIRMGEELEREMTLPEKVNVIKHLVRMASDCRDALEGSSTLVVIVVKA